MYERILDEFLNLCPLEIFDYRPYGSNALCVWLEDDSAIKVEHTGNNEFTVKRTSTEEWRRDVFGA